MFKSRIIAPEAFERQCDPAIAAALIRKYNGAVCDSSLGHRVTSQMKFENGLLHFQSEPCDQECLPTKRVEFDEFFYKIMAVSRRQ